MRKTKVKTSTTTKRKSPESSSPSPDKKKAKSLLPFIKDNKMSLTTGGKDYVIGDTKQWNNQTWHYCDCPNHHNGAQWHIFPAKDCRTCKYWLKKKQKAADGDANLLR